VPIALVVSNVSSQSSSTCRVCRAVLFDKLDTTKMHGLDTSNVSSRVVSRRDEPSGIWALTNKALNLKAARQSRVCYREQQIRTGNCGWTNAASASYSEVCGDGAEVTCNDSSNVWNSNRTRARSPTEDSRVDGMISADGVGNGYFRWTVRVFVSHVSSLRPDHVTIWQARIGLMEQICF